jgi:putative oxidoreductase
MSDSFDLALLLLRLVLGGLLMLLGFLNPLGPVAVIGSMAMATATVHWGKPIWASTGGAELPVTNMAFAIALVLVGPGRFSRDHILGSPLPRWVAVPALLVVIITVFAALFSRRPRRTAAAWASG